MKSIDPSKPVLVTGATGYVAGRLVERLLAEGITVHATVRNPDDAVKTRHLRELGVRSPGDIVFFKADLLQPGSFREAMLGCSAVFHTASPFVTKVSDPQRDLVEPALNGTRNVLETVNEVESVQRVVLTSSVVAMYGDNCDLRTAPGGVLTEALWNTSSSLHHNPYGYSKTLAEREAWEIQKRQSRWDLVVVNPSLVIGPGIDANATSESLSVVRQLGNGRMAMGAPHFELGVVDVRDVAEAHYLAAFRPEAEGRHIVSGHNSSLLQLAQVLRGEFGSDFPFPKRTLPKLLVWLAAPAGGFTRAYVRRNVGYPFRADNSKSRSALGLKYRPLDTSIVELFEQLVAAGQIKRRS